MRGRGPAGLADGSGKGMEITETIMNFNSISGAKNIRVNGHFFSIFSCDTNANMI